MRAWLGYYSLWLGWIGTEICGPRLMWVTVFMPHARQSSFGGLIEKERTHSFCINVRSPKVTRRLIVLTKNNYNCYTNCLSLSPSQIIVFMQARYIAIIYIAIMWNSCLNGEMVTKSSSRMQLKRRSSEAFREPPADQWETRLPPEARTHSSFCCAAARFLNSVSVHALP